MIALTPLECEIRKELITFVKIGDSNNSFVRYKPLAEKFHVPFGNEHERNQLFHMLGNISEYESDNERPLLSVVVVNDEFAPGKGFYLLAKRLQKQESHEDNDKFAIEERKRLFDYWKHNEDPDACV